MAEITLSELAGKLTPHILDLIGSATGGLGSWIYLKSPLTSASWAGNAYSTIGKTLIDLSVVFGAPAEVKAVLVRIYCRDSGSLAATGIYVGLSPNNTSLSMPLMLRPIDIVNDLVVEGNGIVPCDANGDIYYQISASGAGTMDIWVEIWGYML